jgi:hypothetical protein
MEFLASKGYAHPALLVHGEAPSQRIYLVRRLGLILILYRQMLREAPGCRAGDKPVTCGRRSAPNSTRAIRFAKRSAGPNGLMILRGVAGFDPAAWAKVIHCMRRYCAVALISLI